MTLCGLMVMDFTAGIGDREPETGEILYDESNLEHGVHYATDLLGIGHVVDPVDGFDLLSFKKWCLTRLG